MTLGPSYVLRFLTTTLIVVVLLVLAQPLLAQQSEKNELKKVFVNGVELHYIERGQGIPIIFIHGGLADYRYWSEQIEPFSQRYRVIAYSRRYNYPNNNPIRANHSAIVEAADLAALIKKLKLRRVYLVGHSYGAYTALFLAVKHPELVRALILAEPPALRWVRNLPGGEGVFEEFMNNIWKPAGQAFQRGNDEQALQLTIDYFVGKGAFDQLPQEVRALLTENIREWKALTTSPDAIPLLSRDDARRIKIPTLMLTGDRTLRIHQLVNDELEHLLSNGERVRLDATHEMWEEQPEKCRQATLTFLSKH